jgi:hypothetical protein
MVSAKPTIGLCFRSIEVVNFVFNNQIDFIRFQSIENPPDLHVLRNNCLTNLLAYGFSPLGPKCRRTPGGVPFSPFGIYCQQWKYGSILYWS